MFRASGGKMQTHLLLCDIGNTTLKIGVADEKQGAYILLSPRPE